ncbi:MAG: hypothetical protein KAT05_14440 [Spirochaetes bacterium]|nr:hypothetical protein [Spirochaetota bacterium]
MKKKILPLLLVSVFIIFISTCAGDLIKGTVWIGTVQTSTVESDIDAFFRADNTIRVYLELKNLLPNHEGLYMSLEGTYTLSDTDTFIAELKGEIIDQDFDGKNDSVSLNLSGTLNYFTGLGDGEYEMEIGYTSMSKVTNKGEWELTRIGSN